MEINIRPATSADLITIESIAQRTWPATFGSFLTSEQIDYMLGMMYSPIALTEQIGKGHHFLLLNDGNEDIGYVSYQHDYHPGTTKIHKLYVLPGNQGHGYGKQLIAQVKRIAQAAQQQALRLDVNYQNEAIGFYEYLGFVNIGRHDTDIGNGYLMEDFIFEMEL
jgi:ribosomal protein S18 acetylase RimI-like enzyme